MKATTKVPFIAPLEPRVKRDAIAAMTRIIEEERFILGWEVGSLEQHLALRLGVEHVIAVSSGTDALLVSLMALGIGRGDSVITTPYSFISTAEVIARVGARPLFVDIDPHTYNLEQVPATDASAAVLVSLFGRPLPTVADCAIPVVEDAAQSIGAEPASGALIKCLSFFPSKNLGGFGDGGAVCTNGSDTIAEKVRAIRQHGMRTKYHSSDIGGNFRLDTLQAAVLLAKLPHLSRWTSMRRENADTYRMLFQEYGLFTPDVETPAHVEGHVYNQFVIRARNRDGLASFLANAGVATAVYYPTPLHLQDCFHYLEYKEGDFPHAETLAKEALALPIHPGLTAIQIDYVVSSIARFYGMRA